MFGAESRQGSANAAMAKELMLVMGKHPQLAGKILSGGHVVFIPTLDQEVAAANLEMAADLARKGEQVTLIQWDGPIDLPGP